MEAVEHRPPTEIIEAAIAKEQQALRMLHEIRELLAERV
jgi:hypothetical protein